MKKARAVFLDRDGTIIEEVGYLDRAERLKMIPGAEKAISKLNQAGIKVVVVTNQSGIARGYFSEACVEEIHERMREELARSGARIDAFYYCPHHPEGSIERYRSNCDCRKPGIGLLERAAREHNLDLSSCFVVGDKYADVEAGFRAGSRSILVLTGYGREVYEGQGKAWPRQPDHVAEDLSEAADWVLTQLSREAV